MAIELMGDPAAQMKKVYGMSGEGQLFKRPAAQVNYTYVQGLDPNIVKVTQMDPSPPGKAVFTGDVFFNRK